MQTQQTVCATAVNESSTIYSYTAVLERSPRMRDHHPALHALAGGLTTAVSFPGLPHIQFLQYAKMDRKVVKNWRWKIPGNVLPSTLALVISRN